MTDKEILSQQLSKIMTIREMIDTLAKYGCPPQSQPCREYCSVFADAEDCWLRWLKEEREKHEK